VTYCDLKNKLLAIVLGLKSVENGRKAVSVELDYAEGQLKPF